MNNNYQEQSIRLIQLYGTYKMLWDPKDPKYLNKIHREDSWRQMSAEMQCPISELKKKMDSLLGSYRREKSRERKIRITGSGTQHIYVSKWFGYPYFDFMKSKNEPGDTQDTIQTGEAATPRTPDGVGATTENASSTQSQTSEFHINRLIDEGLRQTSQEQHTDKTIYMPTHEPGRKKRRINPKAQTKPRADSGDIMLAEALKCLKKYSSKDSNDPYVSFGRHIANELRKYDPHTLACVKNAIHNIIFEADIGKYTQQQFPPGSFTHQYGQSSTSSSLHMMSPSPAAASSSSVTPLSNINLDVENKDINL